MLPLTVALAKIGIVALIGWWIDLALDDSQHKRIRRKLDNWWTKFDDLTWFNFGRKEGLAALRLFDRAFGKSLWSWQRWISVAVILALSPIVVAVGAVVHSPPFPMYLIEPLWPVVIAVQLISMALSLSITRALTVDAVRFRGFVKGFALLLLLSLVMAVVWAPSAFWFRLRIPDFIRGTVSFPEIILTVVILIPGIPRRRPLHEEIFPFLDWVPGLGTDIDATWHIPLAAMAFASLYADYALSLFRLVFALFFLSCFVLRRFVKQPLSRLGFIWLTSREADLRVFVWSRSRYCRCAARAIQR